MRAIAAFFMIGWGTLAGLFFSGMVIATGHPVKLLDHVLWGAYALLFSTMICVGAGRFLDDPKFGRTLGIISAITILSVFALRGLGYLPIAQ